MSTIPLRPVRRAARAWHEHLARRLGVMVPAGACELAFAAFLAAAVSWKGYNVERWQYPFAELARPHPFQGSSPWSVLFREALALTCASALNVPSSGR